MKKKKTRGWKNILKPPYDPWTNQFISLSLLVLEDNLSLNKSNTHTCTHTHAHTPAPTHTCTPPPHTCTHTHTHKYTCACTSTHRRTHTHAQICTQTHTHTRTDRHTNTHAHVPSDPPHTHTHTHTLPQSPLLSCTCVQLHLTFAVEGWPGWPSPWCGSAQCEDNDARKHEWHARRGRRGLLPLLAHSPCPAPSGLLALPPLLWPSRSCQTLGAWCPLQSCTPPAESAHGKFSANVKQDKENKLFFFF